MSYGDIYIDHKLIDDINEKTFSNEDEKNIFIVNLFNDFYDYLGKIDINKDYNILLFIIHKYIYEFNFNFELLKEYIYNHIFLNITINYFNKIIDFYQTINDKDESKLRINYYIMYFMFKIILLLYSYYHYSKYIYLYFDKIKDKIKKEEKYNNYYLREIILLSIEEKKDDEIKYNFYFEDKDYPKDRIFIFQDKDKNSIYRLIINLFGDEVLDNYIDNRSLSIDDIISASYVIDDKYSTCNPDNILLKFILEYITKFILLYKPPSFDNFINKYITIPQYLENCWYISILTCITYSDLSKKLLMKKIGIKNNIKKIKLLSKTIDQSSKTFIEIIDYLISNITYDYKKYSSIENDCSHLSFFKNNLMNYIYERYYELKNSNKLDNSSDFYNGTNNSYFKYLDNNIASKGSIPHLSDDIIIQKNIKIVIFPSHFLILNSLYNIFDIKTLYLYKIESTLYRQINIEYEEEKTLKSPDIIFMHFITDGMLLHNNIIEFDSKTIKKLDNNIIAYNGYKYKLDYILHGTDQYQTCKNCGHCISGINYNGKQYYYDSAFSQMNIKCNSDNIKISCPLIQHNWIDDINTKKKDKCLYSIKKCFYKSLDINSQKINKNIIDEDKRCFNNLNKIICAYIKIDKYEEPVSSRTRSRTRSKRKVERKPEDLYDDLASRRSRSPKSPKTGGSNNYISTHKKVNIMNKNNTIIERIVYIDNNKNKYIKFNKNYELLKSFKYNKKYYYI